MDKVLPGSVQSRRRNSMDTPPTLKIVLVGHDWVKKNKVGNLLLGQDLFEIQNVSSTEKTHNKVVTGYVLDRFITVANTAELFNSDISDDDLQQRVKECVSLCAPGPHALVLVVNTGGEFNTEKRKRMEYIVRTFSEQAFQHSIVFIHEDHWLWKWNRNNTETETIIGLCGGRVHQYKKTDQTGALKAIKNMISANNWSILTCDTYETALEAEASGTMEMNQSDTVVLSAGHAYSNKLNLVLCGRSAAAKASAADLILGEQTEPSTQPSPVCVKREGKVCGRHVTLVLMPSLSDTQLSEEEAMVQMLNCLQLCHPGIHAFLLVLPVDGQNDEDKKEREIILRIEAQNFILPIHTPGLKQQPEGIATSRGAGQPTSQTGTKEVCVLGNSLKAEALMDEVERMTVKNGLYTTMMFFAAQNSEMKNNMLKLHTHINTLKASCQGPVSTGRLNLVLCGTSTAAKASAAALILGEQTEPSPQPSSVCVKKEAEVHGRHVTLVLLPSLGKRQQSEEALLQETQKCLYLCNPGVHAFIFVIAQDQQTDEDKEEWEKIKHLFGEEVSNCCKTVLTRESEVADGVFIAHNVQETSQESSFILDNSSKVLSLLEEVEMMASTVCYTSDMAVAAQLNSHLKCHSELKDMKMKLEKLQSAMGTNKDPTDDLRIVLLGKTGHGKSASGNTILGGDVFTEELSTESVTTACQKEMATINGRQITVVDTPGLFDTACDNEKTKKEIVRCVAMAAPGPHVFLLVISLGRFTQEERNTVKMIQEIFGDESEKHTLVLFTRGDDLQKKTIEEYLEKANVSIKTLLRQCGNRHHVFNNRDKNNKNQVPKLVEKIDALLKTNGGSYYTTDMFQEAEEALQQQQDKILKQKEEQIQREKEELQAKHEAAMEKLKKEMEEERRRQDEERRRREEDFKCKEQNMKKTIKTLEEEERQKRTEIEETYKEQKKQNEEWLKQRTQEIQQERQRQQEEWDRRTQEEQKRRKEEEKQRIIKEKEYEQLWHERQRQETEKFNQEKEAMMKAAEEEKRKKQEEYEERVQKEEEKRKDLEEKINYAEESRVKELEEQKRKHDEECQRKCEEDKQRQEEEENKWKKQIQLKEQEWLAKQEEQRREKERHEKETREEKQRRDAEQAERKKEEEEERRKIEQNAQRRIQKKEEEMKMLQKELEESETKLLKEQRRSKDREDEQRAEMEERLRYLREQFEEQKEKEAKKHEERERRNMEYLKEMHEKEKDLLKRETELAARKQAEKEFNEVLDRKVKEGHDKGRKKGKEEGEKEGHEQGKEEGLKEGYEKGHKEGMEEVESERTTLGRFIDTTINTVSDQIKSHKKSQ